MADVIQRAPGPHGNRPPDMMFRDETDGSWTPAVTANGRYYNTTSALWEKLTGTGGFLYVLVADAPKTLKSASFSLTATGTVVAAVASKRLKVYALKLVVSAAISVNWRDGGATGLEGLQAFAANGGYVEGVEPPNFLFGTTAGNSLDLVISGTGTAAGRVSYWDSDAT